MTTKFKTQYHTLPSDDDKSRFTKYGRDGGEYTLEAVEALLEPEPQPCSTDQGSEPIFSDKALIVMAIFKSGEADQWSIHHWAKNNFRNPRYRESEFRRNILSILNSDNDFYSDYLDLLHHGGHYSQEPRWRHQPGLQYLLDSMRDTDGQDFSPHQHIMRHADKLKSRAALEPALPFLPKEAQVSGSDSITRGVLELFLEPQWASLPKSNRLEQPFTEKALIVMAFEHTELQQTTENSTSATRRISAQDVMQFYRQLPARLRKRIASAYRAAAVNLYSSEATSIHLSFQLVYESATNSTHGLRRGWRISKNFHLGPDSIGHEFALAMSTVVGQHLMGVGKTMDYMARVQTNDLERQGAIAAHRNLGHRCLAMLINRWNDFHRETVDNTFLNVIIGGRPLRISLRPRNAWRAMKTAESLNFDHRSDCGSERTILRKLTRRQYLDTEVPVFCKGGVEGVFQSMLGSKETTPLAYTAALAFAYLYIDGLEDPPGYRLSVTKARGGQATLDGLPSWAVDQCANNLATRHGGRHWIWIDVLSILNPMRDHGQDHGPVSEVRVERLESPLSELPHGDEGTLTVLESTRKRQTRSFSKPRGARDLDNQPRTDRSHDGDTDSCNDQKSRLSGSAILAQPILRWSSRFSLCAVAGKVRRYLEAPVPSGMKRIRWRCRCGKLIYDDYAERSPELPDSPPDEVHPHSGPSSAPERAMTRLHGSGKARTPALKSDPDLEAEVITSAHPPADGSNQQSAQQGAGHSLRAMGASLKKTLMGHLKADSLPTHNTGNSVAQSITANAPPAPNHLEFLLLCIPFKSHANKLLNVDTTMPPCSDIAFFRLLRQTYTENRGRLRSFFSIRALREIRFVQFEVFRNDLAHVRKYDCIPPKTEKDNYVYQPMPAKYKPPPIGKNQMRHLYDYPDHADEMPHCFYKVPRKLRERLRVAPANYSSEGWGICFIEGVAWPRVCALGLAGVLASTIFGVVWTVVQDDIQGGFGVASYMLGVLVLGLGALQRDFEM